MTPTIWQRGHLNVNDPTSFSDAFLRRCVDEGYPVVQVLINPEHSTSESLDQVPLGYLRKVRATGAKAWGFTWADDFDSPEALFGFVLGARQLSLAQGCALTGFVINAEDGWEQHDMGGERWSQRFLTQFRSHPLTAKLSLALNTYIGCGGINLGAWMNRGARLYCQTFHEANTHEWPIDGYIGWARFYGYTKPSMIKPNWGTYRPYPSRAEQIEHARWAKTVGFSCWYAEGAGDAGDILIPLLREARAAGVCA
jgi:hypothetical protein